MEPSARTPPEVEPGLNPRLWRRPAWARPGRVAVLASSDTAAIVVAVAVAYLAWGSPVKRQPAELYYRMLPLLPVFLLAYGKWGLYPGFGLGAVETLRRLSLSASTIFLSVAALSFVVKAEHLYSRMTFFLSWAGTLVLVPLFRFIVLSAARRLSWWAEPCVIVGVSPIAVRAISALRDAHTLGMQPVVALDPGSEPTERELDGVPVVLGLGQLQRIHEAGVRVVLVAAEEESRHPDLLEGLQRRFRRVILLQSLAGLPADGVAVRNLGGFLGLEFTNQLLQRRNRIIKRTFDVVVGTLLLAATLPLMLLAAVLVWAIDRGPAIFRQQRVGLQGRLFTLRKLRTMRTASEERLEDYLNDDPDARMEWNSRFKLRRDPRLIPGIGRWLRRLSIDELPQLWNVVKGEMSLVGPRPLPVYHLETFSGAFCYLRREVRPGLTGLWQVMARSDAGEDKKTLYDGYYIRNWSIWLDLYVLALTVIAVFRADGAD